MSRLRDALPEMVRAPLRQDALGILCASPLRIASIILRGPLASHERLCIGPLEHALRRPWIGDTAAMIRLMQAEDVDALAAIEKACFEAGYADKMMSREDFASVLNEEDMRIFCRVLDDAVVGYASLYHEPSGEAVNFDSLAVAPEHQGKGLGEELFRHVERYCEETGIPQLNLEIKETNYALLKRYHRYGYTCFDIEAGFYADGWGAIRMKKRFEV